MVRNCDVVSHTISFEDTCLALVQDLVPNNADGQVLLLDFLGYENVSPYIFDKREAVKTLVSLSR